MLLFNATTTVVPSTRGHSRDTIVEEETYQTQTNFTVDAAMLPNVLVGYVTLQDITLSALNVRGRSIHRDSLN